MTISSMSKQTLEDVEKLAAQAKSEGKQLLVEVIADSSGKFCSNMRRFDTAQDAIDYGIDLSGRWMLVTEWRVALA